MNEKAIKLSSLNDSCPDCQDETFWIDKIGNQLEAEGVHSGNIFEFSDSIHDDLVSGGVIVTSGEPGVALRFPFDLLKVKEVYLKDIRGEIHKMGPGRAIFMFNCHKISECF